MPSLPAQATTRFRSRRPERPPTTSSRACSQIVRTIVGLAHALHMEVIAEGVETVEQLNSLTALKCEYNQGF
ncbi:MAG: EAL domain-containing protein [Candidatus Eisenbacteria bacterium]